MRSFRFLLNFVCRLLVKIGKLLADTLVTHKPETHDLIPARLASDVIKDDISFRICAFMNSRRHARYQHVCYVTETTHDICRIPAGRPGTLLVGVNANGQVTGVHMDRDSRDEMRMGLALLWRVVRPPLLSEQLTVRFANVYCARNRDLLPEARRVQDKYVIGEQEANLGRVKYSIQ